MSPDEVMKATAAGVAASHAVGLMRADFSCRILTQLLSRLYEDQFAQIECSSTARTKAAVLSVACADQLMEALRLGPVAIRSAAHQAIHEGFEHGSHPHGPDVEERPAIGG